MRLASRAARASSKPAPISTPFTAWMPISAAASRASSRSSFDAYEPSPGGTPRARDLDHAADGVALGARLVDPLLSPPSPTRPTTSTPISREQRLRHRAGGDRDGRLPRARPLERVARVGEPVLQRPREVGVARAAGSVTGFAPLPAARPPAATGSSPTPSSRGRGCGRRARAASRASGRGAAPRAPRRVSCSSCCRGLRPYPCWRRARSASIASARASARPAARPGSPPARARATRRQSSGVSVMALSLGRVRIASTGGADAGPQLKRRRTLRTSASSPSTTSREPRRARKRRAP